MNSAARLCQLAIALTAFPILHAQESAPPKEAEKKPATTLKETVVHATNSQTAQTPYGPPPSTSITGLPAPIKELPITVNTLSARFIEDTSARRLRDLVGYVPGVNASEDSGATGDLLNIRGFDFLYQYYLNGMRNRVSYNSSRHLQNIDRIEIFKGPGGVEFGAGDPGGFVNFVTKKPESIQSTTMGIEGGSYDYIQGFVDSTGPLWTPAGGSTTDSKGALVNPAGLGSEDLGVFYRMIVSGDSANSFRDAFHTDGYQVAPSILWNYAEGSSVLLEFEYQYRDQPYDRGIMYIERAGFKDNFAPINTSYHEPDDYFENHNTRTSLYWTHKIDDTFTFRLTGEWDTNTADGNGVRSPYTFLLYTPGTNQWNGDPTLLRTTQDINTDAWSFGIKPELLVKFETGSVKHSGLFGVNYLNTHVDTKSMDGFDLRAIDFRFPHYGQTPVYFPHAPGVIPATARDFRFKDELEEFGVYYQHKADITKRIHLLGGVRYDWYDDESTVTRNIRTNLGASSKLTDQNWTGRFGGVVDITDNISLFAGVSNSLQPQTGVLLTGGNPDALEATAVEGGIKASFLDNRLQTTLSIYETERKNLLEVDPTNDVFVIPLGTVDIRGVEFEATGKLTDDLDIQGGFAFMDSEISETEDPATRGNDFYNVPDFQAGLRLRYDTSSWLVKGLSVGLGVVYVGNREGDAENTFELPDYVRFDAGLYYQWRNWNFKLTCENLADETYYLASQGVADIIQPGAPRLFTLGATVKF